MDCQRNAAMACSRTTDAVIHMHRDDGFSATNYLDDLIGVSGPYDGWEAYSSLGRLLNDLGLLENSLKACPPATVQLVLGVLVNTVDGTISVPPDRMEEIVTLVGEWQGKKRSSKVELQSLIGKLQYVSKCVLQSRVFLNRLLDSLRSMKKKKSIHLSASFQKDVKWWAMFIEKYNGVSFIPASIWTEPDVSLATDSCLVGCGGLCDKEYFHASFPESVSQQQLPIHCLEMLIQCWLASVYGARDWKVRKCRFSVTTNLLFVLLIRVVPRMPLWHHAYASFGSKFQSSVFNCVRFIFPVKRIGCPIGFRVGSVDRLTETCFLVLLVENLKNILKD